MRDRRSRSFWQAVLPYAVVGLAAVTIISASNKNIRTLAAKRANRALFNILRAPPDSTASKNSRLQYASTTDIDGDHDVDLADYRIFSECLTGPSVRQLSRDCVNADLDRDGDVDLADFSERQTWD